MNNKLTNLLIPDQSTYAPEDPTACFKCGRIFITRFKSSRSNVWCCWTCVDDLIEEELKRKEMKTNEQ